MKLNHLYGNIKDNKMQTKNIDKGSTFINFKVNDAKGERGV
ncbi:hypothetical protein [Wolbachia endosymbiont of Litomosoides brasiliensis]|nr:hypothetical protein [Wolbachia endosymbiont of Litomosoides brasiliensis]